MSEYRTGRRKKKKRIMRTFKINEISAVDSPAQAPAKALIMKRNDDGSTDSVQKFGLKAALTTSEEDHTHLVILEDFEGEEMRSGMTSFAAGHEHPWIMTEAGDIVIGLMGNHTHTIETVGKVEDLEKRTFTTEQREKLAEEGKALPDGSFPIVNRTDLENAIQAFGRAGNQSAAAKHIKRRARALGATEMLPTEGKLADLMNKDAGVNAGDSGQTEKQPMKDDKQQAGDLQATVDKLNADLKKATQLAGMNDAQKVHYASLQGETADAFLNKSFDERQAELSAIEKAAKEADPVVYTTLDGIQIRKSAGEAVYAAVMSADKVRKDNEELRKQNERHALEKRAQADLQHLPGDLDVQVEMLKAIDGIESPELREKAHAMLKANDAGLSYAFEKQGHEGAGKGGSAIDELENLSKAYAEKHSVSFEKAQSEVLKTAQGQQLYAKTVG